jgi:ketosteroid isomerase-like protein
VSQENVEILRRAYEAFALDGMDGVAPLLDEKIEWASNPDSPDAEVRHGHQGVRDWFTQRLFEDVRFVPDEIKELPDGRVLSLGRLAFRAEQSGVAMDVPFAHAVTIRDGLITRFKMYSDQQQALKAVGLEDGPPAAT